MEFYNWFKLISSLLISTYLSNFPKKIQFSSNRKKNNKNPGFDSYADSIKGMPIQNQVPRT